ncbi:MAG: B12-binding domain-containing radical SAM protein [Deltaproteobacteria bacterium]|nr:B12-binding domain-containing radical SAM protein [Deltaproteobacteria bacterium]
MDGTNTAEIRMRWLGLVLEALKELDIPVRQTNYYFEGEDIYWSGRDQDVTLGILPPADVDTPPRALVQTSSYLAKKGLGASCVDLNIKTYKAAEPKYHDYWNAGRRDEWADAEQCRKRMETLGIDAAAWADRFLERKAPNIAFYVRRSNMLVTRTVMELIRAKDPARRLIVYGPSAAIEAERDLFPDAVCDYVVTGEAETSLTDLLWALRGNADINTVRGVRWTGKDGHKRDIPREPLMDLSGFPAPDYRELKPQDYGDVLEIRASRGCKYRCAFCAEQPVEGPARYRPAREVFEEMAEAYRVHNTRAFRFTDLIANGNPKQLEELADLLIAARLPVRFEMTFAPTDDMTAELYRKLKAAGCKAIHFGVESLSDRVLEAMNKTYNARVAQRNLADAHDAGVETHVNLIVGFPGEKQEDIYLTMRRLKQSERHIDFVDTISQCQVLPKTKLERQPGR